MPTSPKKSSKTTAKKYSAPKPKGSGSSKPSDTRGRNAAASAREKGKRPNAPSEVAVDNRNRYKSMANYNMAAKPLNALNKPMTKKAVGVA
jgi:hypothetical protein